MTCLNTLLGLEESLDTIADEMLKTKVLSKNWDVLTEKYKQKCVGIYAKSLSRRILKTDNNRIYNKMRA